MNFLAWHYNKGVGFYLSSWKYCFDWVLHYFSLFLLLKGFFAPWKKLIIEDEAGFNINKFFQKLTFNLTSRGIGAIVRSFLIFAALVVLLLCLVLGALGFVVWLVIPLFGLFEYWRQKQRLTNFTQGIVKEMKLHPKDALSLIFDNNAGRFLLSHLGIESSLFNGKEVRLGDIEKLDAKNYEELIKWLIEALMLNEEFFRQQKLSREDLIAAARWWDENKEGGENKGAKSRGFGRPGIGLELLFGYTPQLDACSVDLSTPQNFYHHLIGREEIVSRIERTLVSGSGVFLVGQPGVGKKTVILEFAHKAASGLLVAEMDYRRVMEFDYNFLLSGSLDLNIKKTKLSAILDEASRAGNIILVIRDLHRLTNSVVEGFDFTDIFEQYLEQGNLKIIAITSPVEYERFLAPNLRLAKFMKPVEVVPPSEDEALSILMAVAEDWELKNKVTVLAAALRRIVDGCDRYVTEIPFPEKAIDLFEEAGTYVLKKGGKKLTTEDVDVVLSEKTGITFGQLTDSTKQQLEHLEEVIHKQLVNQETAVSLVAKSLRASSLGVKSADRPTGSFLFLGPTGVGKTQTAKVLAQVYYGSEKNLTRFDMAEFAGKEGLSRLIGSLSENQPGALTTAIKNHPASLLLLDEIEKAPNEVVNLFLTLLDEGRITDAFGRQFNCRHLFVIATSNAGAEYIRELIDQGETGGVLQKKVVDYILKNNFFSPEFLNRFDGVVVFEPLKQEYLPGIAKLLLGELQEGLKKQNIALEITPDVCAKLANDGFDPSFGARPMRRILDLVIGDVLGKGILKGEIKSGDKIKLTSGINKEEYGWEKLE